MLSSIIPQNDPQVKVLQEAAKIPFPSPKTPLTKVDGGGPFSFATDNGEVTYSYPEKPNKTFH